MWAFIEALPRDSAVARALAPEASQWGNTEELLAAACELLDLNNRLLMAAHRDPKKSGPLPKPIQIRRPGDRGPEKPRVANRQEMAAFFKGRARRVT